MKDPCTYILASCRNGTLYIGVTSDIYTRMSEHAQGLLDGFTKKHGVTKLVWYGYFNDMDEAISREKQLKKWQRTWKIRLIESMNPEWVNLYNQDNGEIIQGPADTARCSG